MEKTCDVQILVSGNNIQYHFSEQDIQMLKQIQQNLGKGWTLKAAAPKAISYREGRVQKTDTEKM